MDFLKEHDPKVRNRLKKETIDDLLSVADDCFSEGRSDYSLAFANSLLSLIAILVSKEFDDLLADTCNDAMNKIIIFSLIDQHRHRVQSQYNLEAVRVFDEQEKKKFCEPGEVFKPWANLHEKQRIVLSIDPYTAPEEAARLVKEIVKQWRDERFSADKADWLEDGFSDEQAKELAERDLLDYHRTTEGKIPRSGSTFFAIWLRRLRVYRAHQNGYTYEEISQLKWFGGDGRLAWKDGDKAKQLVSAALRGQSIFSIKQE